MYKPIKPSKSHSSAHSFPFLCIVPTGSVACAVLLCLSVHEKACSQGIIMSDFNSGNDLGWTHYAPLQTAPWNEQVTWTFPPSSAGALGYRIFGGITAVPRD